MSKIKIKDTQPSRKHLTYYERAIIQDGLNNGKSISVIAKNLSRNKSTIYREIQRNSKKYNSNQNECIKNELCSKRHVCGLSICYLSCAACHKCSKYCKDFLKATCMHPQNKIHGVCNACKKFKLCRYTRIRYEADYAQARYEEVLVDSRSGFDLTLSEMEKIDNIVSPLIKKGHSPYAIIKTEQDKLGISESTLRRLIRKRELTTRDIDLRSVVKRKPRTQIKMKREIISSRKIGHLYSDYLDFISENDIMRVQMDVVEGLKTDNKVLLTLHYPLYHFQMAFIMDNHTSDEVVNTLDLLEISLGPDMFRKMFPLILTDNGHEFTDVEGMERSLYGGKRTLIFFCEPNRSDQKGECENNHRLIRYVLPKGSSFDNLVQPQIVTMMNHINSYVRKGLFGKSPIELAKLSFPKEFFDCLGYKEIEHEKINLTPSLLDDIDI